MSERRSIQDIIPPARSKPIRASIGGSETNTPPPPKTPMNQNSPRREGKNVFGLVFIALGIVAVVIATFTIISTVFYRAEVSVTLNQFKVTVADTFEATPEGLLFSYQQKNHEETLSTTVSQTGKETVEERAAGTIVIYNIYSTQSQRLITNTRFESSDGLVYRIKNSVVVPGYKTVSDKKVPGELEATVFADEPGEKYNIGPTDFTIPGLKGTAQYEGMYARSKGSLAGGFVGERAVVDSGVRDAALLGLKSQLEKSAQESFIKSLTEGEIVFPNTIQVTFVDQPDKAGDSDATISLKAIARAPVFSESQLAKLIAAKGNVIYDNQLSIQNLNELAALVEEKADSDAVSVTISGEAKLIGSFNEDRLIQDLAGKDERNVGVVLSGYPAVSDMRVSVYPFWRGSLPKNIERIKILIQSPE